MLMLAGCSAAADLVPKDGPTAAVVRRDAEVEVQTPERPLAYALVELSPATVNIVNRTTQASVPRFHDLPARKGSNDEAPLGVGDVISVTVFEVLAGGLFIPAEASVRPGNLVQMPSQQIDGAGQINVPYAGPVTVAGKTAKQVSEEISRRLSHRAIEPQTIVSVVERRANGVSVLGEVNLPTRFSMDPGGIRVLGAIARAGGSKSPPYESIVTLQRGRATQQALLSAIVKDPNQNVSLAPGDSVFVTREPKAFMAFGATPETSTSISGPTRRFLFESDNFTLAEGLAKAGGLVASRSDPRGLFVLRFEKRAALAALGVDVSAYSQDIVPTVYSVDLSRTEGFFLMNSFYLRHMDMVVATDSPTADFVKFIAIMDTLSNIAGNSAIVTNAAK